MNREILFRGRSFSDGSWVYGDLEYERNKGLLSKVRIHTYKDDGSYDRQHLVESDTVGQFTGLCDKNGVKIFEGDIMKTGFSQKAFGVVKWNSQGYFYLLESWCLQNNYAESDHRPLGEMLVMKIDGKPTNFEVIGNIYDNPELLAAK